MMTDHLISHVRDDASLQQAIDQAVEAVNAEEGSILLVDESTHTLNFTVTCSPFADKLIGLKHPMSEGIVGVSMSFQQAVIENNTKSDPNYHSGVDQAVGSDTQSMLVVPLSNQEYEFGVVTAVNCKSHSGFSPDDLERYTEFAQRITDRIQAIVEGQANV